MFATRRHKGGNGVSFGRSSGQVWEHRIRDEQDFSNHIDYIHYNPVKHGYVKRPVSWGHSSIHRTIRQGILPATWCDDGFAITDGIGHEQLGLRLFATQQT